MKSKMQMYLRSIKKIRRKIRSEGTILRCKNYGEKIKNREIIGIIARKTHDRIVWSYGNEMNETQSYHRSCLYYPLAVARRQYLLTFFNKQLKQLERSRKSLLTRSNFDLLDRSGITERWKVLCFYYYCLIYSYRINELSNATITIILLAITQNYL